MFIFIFSLILFFIGLTHLCFTGVRNLLTLLICIEIMLLGVSLLFVSFSYLINLPDGIVCALLILLVGVNESVLGLSLCILALKTKGSIEIEVFKNLKH